MSNSILSRNNSSISKDAASGFDFANTDLQGVSHISISIASPEDILTWSFGEVKKSETISYRTYKPESDGLFSARIFGPTRDYECQCGKYRRMKYKGIVCEKCGVEITTSKVRRERLGHIELVSPVINSLFLRRTNSPIAMLLGMTVKDIEKIAYFESYVVSDPTNTSLKEGQVLSEQSYAEALEQFGDTFKVESGADAIYNMLARFDLRAGVESLNKQLLDAKSESKKRPLLKKIKLLNDFISSNNRPEWMILKRLPVLPPDLRPLVQLDGGRFVSSDLNELYRRVINRNDRLRRMLEAKAPDIIVRNEKRMLQESVDALFDNSKKAFSSKNSMGRPLKSLTDFLKGKQGRFRQNLLGKRVDYSGRSVIIVGPDLALHECGLPKLMALELFKPHIFSRLIAYGKVGSVRIAKKMVDQQVPEVWDALEEVIKDRLVLLNRAPTLHRLNIQAFQPKLIEAKAIQLHPLVCKAFNADFDGDQMAVHVPLSIEAQTEAWILMLSSNNILSPQNGEPITIPTKDIVVGLYYITAPSPKKDKQLRYFDNYRDMLVASDNGLISVNTSIKYYYNYSDVEDKAVADEIHSSETTMGRVMIWEFFPKDGKIKFEDINVTINNKNISSLLHKVYDAYGQEKAVDFADMIKSLGFKYSTKAGISFGKDDMIIPSTKQKHINDTLEKIKLAEQQYAEGYITFREKYNQVTDRWSECTDIVAKDMMKELTSTKDTEDVNSVYMMMLSGARVSEPVMRQIAGMRGLIAKPSGEIIESPIISNFKEGMTVIEYFNSAHGARKGAADTALKTADAGYLTRRLVDVAQDCIVTEYDCKTLNSTTYQAKMEDGKVVVSLSKIVFGRVVFEDVVDGNGNVLIAKNTPIDRTNIDIIDQLSLSSLKVRSLVHCEAKDGVCSLCYGKDLSTGKIVNEGEAVGIVAAQSIGEPGAQLTMRTFHIGGATSRSIEKSAFVSDFKGKISFDGLETVLNSKGENIVVSSNAKVMVSDSKGTVLSTNSIPYSSYILVKDGDSVDVGTAIAKWDPYNTYIVSEYDGVVAFCDLVPDVSYHERSDEDLERSYKIVFDWTSIDKTLNPRVVINDKSGKPIVTKNGNGIARYMLPVDSIITLNNGHEVSKGDILARIPRESLQAVKDITGGLPRVEDIFEARVPKDPAIIAEIDGFAKFTDDYKSRNHLVITSSEDPTKEVSYHINRGRYVRINEGSFVKKGDVIVDGKLDPHDILTVSGVDALSQYVIDEVQQVYRLQGVHIDNKHIEVIVRYMLQKVEIVDRGDCPVLNEQQCDIKDVLEMNAVAVSEGKKPAKFIRILQGITRASLRAESFISAASFQETSRVLTEAAVAGKKDLLKGIKENVIIGRLIPAGTGYSYRKLRTDAISENNQLESASGNNSSEHETDSLKKESVSNDNVANDSNAEVVA